MLQTYKATLQGNQLQWSGDAPGNTEDHPVEVYVTILTENKVNGDKLLQGQKMAAALEKIAKNNSLDDITDPVVWQRDARADRELPGRDS